MQLKNNFTFNSLCFQIIIVLRIYIIFCNSQVSLQTDEDILKFEEEAHLRIQKGELQNIDTDHLILFFYNSSSNDFTSIPSTKIEAILEQEYYDPTKNILIYTVGQRTGHNDPRVMHVINHFIKTKKYNVIFLEYLYYAPDVYYTFINSRYVGRAFAGCLTKFIRNYEISPDRIELHGHSAGGIVVAEIAKVTHPKIGLLVGIDPGRCGGLFRRGYAQHTISLRSDAQYNSDIVWDSDTEIILNNGLRIQPGCEEATPEESCSHVISMFHWMYMVSNPELFYGVECNEIKCNYSSIVTNIGPDFRQKGTFYLRTLPVAPYGMGLQGVKNIIPTQNSTFAYKTYYVDHGQYLPANYDMCLNLGN
ncbi:phospholipase A1-like [Chrysoperla carnea]|uniref:phospholipase A1-like n=1 Tax=Chrysoperla carnea TaxID=189513 RepID=UPI001D0729EC|nr:phospholipase A1-like [Chrysoperla carnea]